MSDFLSFIVVEHIRFFHGAINYVSFVFHLLVTREKPTM